MDSTKVTDAEKIEYGAETLAQQREKIIWLNRKKRIELVDEGKSIDEIIEFAKQEYLAKSQYDLSGN